MVGCCIDTTKAGLPPDAMLLLAQQCVTGPYPHALNHP
jgi:hypothetical protein